ncbi:putative CCR4-NOT transcription complex subunit 5, partial [Plasmodium gaboni]
MNNKNNNSHKKEK